MSDDAHDSTDGDDSGDAEVVDDHGEGAQQPAITEPGKLMRIALMLREMQEEVRRASPDESGRERLRVVHERAMEAMCGVLSDDLQQELNELTLPFDDETPSESEILIAQAQLIGWLEGLFQGIQAALYNQQSQARQQLDQMRQRGLPTGAGGGPGQDQSGAQQQQGPPDPRRGGTGQYL
jgi:hypothetical protein